jgi:hypothetical protein
MRKAVVKIEGILAGWLTQDWGTILSTSVDGRLSK